MAKCEYCSKEFTKEKTLLTHVCEQKRRHQAKNEKHSVLALQAFIRFYELNSPLSDGKKTFNDFVKSPFYNGFIKFGSFVNNIKPLYPSKYIEWLIKNGIHLDKWCKDSTYDKYVVSLIYTESVESALERTVTNMQLWADKNNSEWNQYFNKVPVNIAYFDLRDGKISPWLLLNCQSGVTLLSKFREDQLNSIITVLNFDKWEKIFNNHEDDIKLVKQIVEAGKL